MKIYAQQRLQAEYTEQELKRHERSKDEATKLMNKIKNVVKPSTLKVQKGEEYTATLTKKSGDIKAEFFIEHYEPNQWYMFIALDDGEGYRPFENNVMGEDIPDLWKEAKELLSVERPLHSYDGEDLVEEILKIKV